MPRSYKAAAIQFQCVTGKNAWKHNTEKALHYLHQAVQQDAKLIVLPEGFDYGYNLDRTELTEIQESSSTVALLQSFARDHQVTIAAGIFEREATRFYNRSVIINELGVVAKYTKIHLFKSAPMWENQTFCDGAERVMVRLKIDSVGLLICYDLRFPELARSLVLDGATTLLLSSAWPLARKEHMEALAKVRAIENQVFLISANQVGKNAKSLEFAGSSAIYDPLGNILAQAPQDREAIITAEINPNKIFEVRNFMNCLGHRMPKTYHGLENADNARHQPIQVDGRVNEIA